MNNKKTYETIDQILGIIERFSPNFDFEKESKQQSIQRKILDRNVQLFEVTLQEKAYILANSFEEARKCADVMSDFGSDYAGVVTDTHLKIVQSGEEISDLISKDKHPFVSVIGDKGNSYAPSLFTLNELVPEMFPSKEKEELQKKLDKAITNFLAAQQELVQLQDQLKATK